VTVDVAVRDLISVPHSFYICECKHWAKHVSQSEIHAFRTVVLEAGANRGFLIARSGFQPGAIAAAVFTNIDLLTWDEFEALMFDRWLGGFTDALRPLLTYASALINTSDEELWKRIVCTDSSWQELQEITSKHQLILLWRLFSMSAEGRSPNWITEAIVELGPESAIDGKPIDTFRRLADLLESSCRLAIGELERFWKIPQQWEERDNS
jgi:hypothetical protein